MMDCETNSAPNPTTINIVLVAEILQDIKGQVAAIRNDLDKIKTKTTDEVGEQIIDKCANRVVASLDCVESNNKKEIDKFKEEVKHLKFKNRTLTNVVERLSVEISELKIRADNADLFAAKKSISLSGFYSSDNKEELKGNYRNFLRIIWD